MNKYQEQFSNKSNYLQNSRFTDDNQYQRSNQRHDSCGSEEFTSYSAGGFFRSDYISQNLTSRTTKAAPEKNGAPEKTWIKSDGNCSPSKDDRNTRLQYARRQNSDHFPNKLSTKSNIYENIDHENNVHSTTKNIQRLENNGSFPERVESTGVFKSGQNQNINHDKSNCLYISTSNEKYKSLGDTSKECVSNTSVTIKVDTTCSELFSFFQEFLHYNVSLMPDQQLIGYSFALKDKILEKMSEFEDPEDQAELKFLCAITNRTQMPNNQRLITLRMNHVLNRYFKKEPVRPKSSGNCLIPFEYPQRFDATSKNAEECNLWRKHDEIVMKYERSIANGSLNHENSVRTSFNTEGISDRIKKEELPLPEIIERGSKSNVNQVSGNRVHNDFQRTPPGTDSEGETLDSVDEPLDEDCSVLNIRVTKSVSDYKPEYKNSIYQYYRLENLLDTDVNSMNGTSLIEYAFVLKDKVLDIMNEFSGVEQEKLELLCELTDGTQLEVNQRLITRRMRDLVTISLQENS